LKKIIKYNKIRLNIVQYKGGTMEKIKILGIAPFQNMKNNMDNLAKNFDDVIFTSYVGDLEEGVDLGVKYQDYYDVIISRGGTAKLLANMCRIPVVEIEISMLDILRTIKLIESYNNDYAFIGFSNITKQIVILAEILEKNINIITIEHKNELKTVIKKLKKNGISLIIGDHVTLKFANEYNINSMLIESGKESIEESIKNASFIGENFKKAQYFYNAEKEIQQELSWSTFILNNNLEIIFESAVFPTKQRESVKKFVKELIEEEKFSKSKHIQLYNNSYLLKGSKRDNRYYVILTKVTPDFKKKKHFINFINLSDKNAEKTSNSSTLVGNVKKEIDNATKYAKKFLIYGEKGTGKNKAASTIAKKIGHKNNWYIDFSKNFTTNDWQKLVNSSSSIFFDTKTTFIVSGLEYLTSDKIRELLFFIKNYTVKNSNWIIIFTLSSITQEVDYKLKTLRSEFDGYTLKMEPLSLRKDELNSLVTIYLYELNNELNKNVLGFEPRAFQILADYNWPENIDQLKRVLRNLVIRTKTPFILKKDTEQVILHEKQITRNYPEETTFSDNFLKNNSLITIEKKIIKKVVELYSSNKTKAAESLAISRSTLWKYLK